MTRICCVQDEGIKNDFCSFDLSTGYRKVEFKALLNTGIVTSIGRREK